jgi:hypothetical protein
MGAMKMKTSVKRQSVDLTGYPELVVIYLGMRVNALTGLKTLLGLGPQINKAGAGRPPGLLHFENKIIYSLFPLHVGMRWLDITGRPGRPAAAHRPRDLINVPANRSQLSDAALERQ